MTKSEQARADAMADAETLRRVLGIPTWGEMDRRASERGLIAVAGCYGDEACRWMQDGHDYIEAAFYAEAAARAAFRACPALKED